MSTQPLSVPGHRGLRSGASVLQPLEPVRLGEPLLNSDQVAQILQMSPQYVRKHARELGALRVGGGKGRAGRLRFRSSSIERFIRQRPRA